MRLPFSFLAALSVGSPNTLNTQDPIRWGILSAGRISSDFAKAIQFTEGAEVVAVAARSKDKAVQFAKDHSIPHAYGNYEELLSKEDLIDVVYIGSIADQHAHWARQALLAGIPTVVEKPLTLTFQDTQALVDLAQQQSVFLLEGMWTRCFPAIQKAQQLIQEGAIGNPVFVQADFGWSTQECPTDHRIWYPQSGGLILDVGMYMGQLGQLAFRGDQLQDIQAMGSLKNGVDHTVVCNCRYSGGGYLQFVVTGEANSEERVVLQGTQGRIIIEPPSHTPSRLRVIPATNTRYQLQQETLLEFPLPDDSYTTWNYPGSIGGTYQVQQVGQCLRRGDLQCPYFTWNDTLEVARMLDEIRSQVIG